MHSHLLINFRLKLYNVLFSQFFDFLLIDLCFWIVDRQNLHESVTWVAKTFDPETHLPKIVRTIFSKTLVNSVPIAHQQQSIEVHKGITRGLMNSGYDCFALLVRKILQNFTNSSSHEGIKPRSRLIK